MGELSLYNNQFDFEHLIEYNVPSDSDVDEWFDDNFHFNENQTTYWFSINPICDEEWSSFPLKLVSFLNLNTSCPLGNPCYEDQSGNAYEQNCAPRLLGDGKCDLLCRPCALDNGDCLQLCFASELTNCSLSLISNDVCDDECNNIYCASDPEANAIVPDNGNCESVITNSTVNEEECLYSSWNSDYLDPNVLAMYPDFPVSNTSYSSCSPTAIGDGRCEDLCNTEECLFDGGDCDSGAGCGELSDCYYIYNQAWLVFFTEIYEMKWSEFCDNIYNVFVFGLKYDPDEAEPFEFWDEPPRNCSTMTSLVDFNRDSWINFREFTVVTQYLYGRRGGFVFSLNCSDCIQADNYNFVHMD